MSWKIFITGRVQGVGFRPSVYKVALALELIKKMPCKAKGGCAKKRKVKKKGKKKRRR